MGVVKIWHTGACPCFSCHLAPSIYCSSYVQDPHHFVTQNSKLRLFLDDVATTKETLGKDIRLGFESNMDLIEFKGQAGKKGGYSSTVACLWLLYVILSDGAFFPGDFLVRRWEAGTWLTALSPSLISWELGNIWKGTLWLSLNITVDPLYSILRFNQLWIENVWGRGECLPWTSTDLFLVIFS